MPHILHIGYGRAYREAVHSNSICAACRGKRRLTTTKSIARPVKIFMQSELLDSRHSPYRVVPSKIKKHHECLSTEKFFALALHASPEYVETVGMTFSGSSNVFCVYHQIYKLQIPRTAAVKSSLDMQWSVTCFTSGMISFPVVTEVAYQSHKTSDPLPSLPMDDG